MENLAPIIIFAYNRLGHLKTTVKHLEAARLSELSTVYIYVDGPKVANDKKVINEIKEFCLTLQHFKNVNYFFSELNKGLANSVIYGVTEVLEKHGKAIIFEDDIICTKDFLEFANEALNLYEHDMEVFSISGYLAPIKVNENVHDVFLIPRASSWGWATWHSKWIKADWAKIDYQLLLKNDQIRNKYEQGGADLLPMLIKQQLGIIDSWAIRWNYVHFINNAYCVYPKFSKILNIGTDSSGTNFNFKTDRFKSTILNYKVKFPEKIRIDRSVLEGIKAMYSVRFYRRLYNYFKYGIPI